MNGKKAIIATLLIFVLLIFSFAACKRNGDSIVVTDANGNPVTDEHGNEVTIIPETEIVKVTDENGVPVTDKNGNEVTSVNNVNQEVEIIVTDGNGESVTNEDGTPKTEVIVVPNETTTGIVINVPVTDENGETQTNESGEVVTETTVPYLPEDSTADNIITSIAFGGTGNDKVVALKETSDGGYIALMQSASFNGAFSVNEGKRVAASAIAKYSKDSKQEWIVGVGGNKVTNLNDLYIDKDGNIYVCGETKAKDFVSLHGKEYDAFIQKYTSAGKLVFTKHWGGTQNESFYSLVADSSGNIYAVGFAYSNDGDCESLGMSKGQAKAVIVKFDKNGNVSKVKGMGAFGDYFSDIDINSKGEIFLSAVLTSKLSDSIFTSKGYSDIGVIKINGDLDVVKSAHWGGNYVDTITSIIACEDGGFVVVGNTSSTDGSAKYLGNKGGQDALIMKWTKDCKLAWVKTFAGTGDDRFTGVAQCADGSYIAVGYSNSANRDFTMVGNIGGQDGLIVKFSQKGEVLKAKCIGGSGNDQFNDVCILAGGRTVAGGSTLSNDGYFANLYVGGDGKKTQCMIFTFRF